MWDTCGHLTKIFIIFYYTKRHIFIEPSFLNTSEWSKWSCKASANTAPHRQWDFGWGYHSIFNSFSTIYPHHHVKYSRLNCNVKRMVEIDPSVEKIEWFADLVLALTTTRVQMQPKYFIFLISWSPWVSFIYLHILFRQVQGKLCLKGWLLTSYRDF
jgi:hypothetical protein